MVIEGIQAYAKCAGCCDILWTETSEHEQRCGCSCGDLQIKDEIVTGMANPTFFEADMIAILEATP